MKCFYHNDADGRAAGWVVYKYGPRDEYEPEFIEMNYDKTFPMDTIEENEVVYIVDYHIKPDEMHVLLALTENVVWIDHHVSAIKEFEDFPGEIKGLREIGKGGCVLTWEYLVPTEPTPAVLLYVGDRDVWEYRYEDNTRNFCAGAELHDLNPLSDFWKHCRDIQFVQDVMKAGEVIRKYKMSFYTDLRESIGFEVDFEGYRCLALNVARTGSDGFGDGDELLKDYDILISFFYQGEQYIFSLYSHKDEIDVSEIAKKHGGGGHKQAAGFQMKTLPNWRNL